MVLLLLCILFISFAKPSSPPDGPEYISIAYPIMFALTLSVIFAFGALTIKMALIRGYPAFRLSVDYTFSAGLFYLILFLYTEAVPVAEWDEGFTLEAVLQVSLAGAFIISALVFQSLAQQTGKGGLVMAIIQS